MIYENKKGNDLRLGMATFIDEATLPKCVEQKEVMEIEISLSTCLVGPF